jgi:glycerol uptake facilitator-like aquaporin
LAYVVLNVATGKHHPDNSYYGLAIGFTVLAGAFAVGAISGGAFNPAVTLGAAVMGMFAWPTLWVYLAAQIIGAAAAGVTFLALNPDDRDPMVPHAKEAPVSDFCFTPPARNAHQDTGIRELRGSDGMAVKE